MMSRQRWRPLVVLAAAVCVICTPALGQESAPPQREQDQKKQDQKKQQEKSEDQKDEKEPKETEQESKDPQEQENRDPTGRAGGRAGMERPIGWDDNPYTGDEELPPRPEGSDPQAYSEWRAKTQLILMARRKREVEQGSNIVYTQSTVRQLGTVFDHQVQTLEFPFRNDGKSDLLIRGTRASCGCTVAELEKQVYEPGESGTITVTFDPLNRTGFQHKYVEVITNDPVRPATRIGFEAEVQQLITISPPMLSMPAVVRGHEQQANIWVFGRTDDFEAYIEPDYSRPWLTIERVGTREEKYLRETRRGTRFVVTVGKDVPEGRHSIDLNVTSNDERSEGRTMQMIVGVVGDIGFRPLRLNAGKLEPGEIYERTISLYSRNAEPFELTDAVLEGTLAGDDAELQWEAEPLDPESNDVYNVTVRFRVPEQRLFSGLIRFTTDRPQQRTVAVPYTGSTNMPAPEPEPDTRAQTGQQQPPPESAPPENQPPRNTPPRTKPPVVPPPAAAV